MLVQADCIHPLFFYSTDDSFSPVIKIRAQWPTYGSKSENVQVSTLAQHAQQRISPEQKKTLKENYLQWFYDYFTIFIYCLRLKYDV